MVKLLTGNNWPKMVNGQKRFFFFFFGQFYSFSVLLNEKQEKEKGQTNNQTNITEIYRRRFKSSFS